MLGGAQTGTGKTAGFTLPMLQRLSDSTPADSSRRPIRALILTPTRELAAQVNESVVTYGKYLSLTSAVVFGGVKINPQIDRLRRGVDILVATPGRLLDHVGQRTVDLSKVEILVLDEADRMLDMGFIRDIRKVLALLPKKRQNLLFSATFAEEIKKLADDLLNSPTLSKWHAATPRPKPCHRSFIRSTASASANCCPSDRFAELASGAGIHPHQARRRPPRRQLERDGIKSAVIHGNKSQGARTRAWRNSSEGTVACWSPRTSPRADSTSTTLPHVVNLRAAQRRRRLCASHRPHRTRRQGRSGPVAGVRR